MEYQSEQNDVNLDSNQNSSECFVSKTRLILSPDKSDTVSLLSNKQPTRSSSMRVLTVNNNEIANIGLQSVRPYVDIEGSDEISRCTKGEQRRGNGVLDSGQTECSPDADLREETMGLTLRNRRSSEQTTGAKSGGCGTLSSIRGTTITHGVTNDNSTSSKNESFAGACCQIAEFGVDDAVTEAEEEVSGGVNGSHAGGCQDAICLSDDVGYCRNGNRDLEPKIEAHGCEGSSVREELQTSFTNAAPAYYPVNMPQETRADTEDRGNVYQNTSAVVPVDSLAMNREKLRDISSFNKTTNNIHSLIQGTGENLITENSRLNDELRSNTITPIALKQTVPARGVAHENTICGCGSLCQSTGSTTPELNVDRNHLGTLFGRAAVSCGDELTTAEEVKPLNGWKEPTHSINSASEDPPQTAACDADRLRIMKEGMSEQPGPRHWYLEDTAGQLIPLPGAAVSVGSAECDLQIQSQGVEGRHAVLTFDPNVDTFVVKDLSSTGTFINGERVQGEELAALRAQSDTVRFGTDPMEYRLQCHQRDEPIPPHRMPSATSTPQEGGTLMPTKEDKEAPHLAPWVSHRDATRVPAAHAHLVDDAMNECPGCLAEQGLRHPRAGLEDFSHPHYGSYSTYTTDNPYPTHSAASIHYNSVGHNGHPVSQTGHASYSHWHSDQSPGQPPGYHQQGYPPRTQGYTHPLKTPDQLKELDPYFQKAAAADSGGEAVSLPYPPSGVYSTHESVAPHPQRSYGGHFPVNEGEEYGPPSQDPHYPPPPPARVIPHPRYSGPHHYHPHHGPHHHVHTYLPQPYTDYPPTRPHLVHRAYTKVIPKEDLHYLGGQHPVTSSVRSNVPIQHTFEITTSLNVDPDSISSDVDFREDRTHCGAVTQPEVLTPLHSQPSTKISQIEDRTSATIPDPHPISEVALSITEQSGDPTDPADQGQSAVSSISNQPGTPVSSVLVKETAGQSIKPCTTQDVIKRSQELIERSQEVIQRSESIPEAAEKERRNSVNSADGESGKKGSALYGQPAWWGQDDHDTEYSYPHTSTLTGRGREGVDDITSPERPTSLHLPTDASPTQPMDTFTNSTQPNGVSNGHPTAPRNHANLHTPPERDTGPGESLPEEAEKPSAMAFTISFGEDEDGEKKKAPLSQFLPSKVRKNFRQREKEKEKRESVGSRDSSAERSYRPSSRDPSPGHSRQSKSAAASPKTPRRRGGYHSDGHHSNGSSGGEDGERVPGEDSSMKDLESFSRYVEGYMTMLNESTSEIVTSVKKTRTSQTSRVSERKTPTESSPSKPPGPHGKRSTDSKKTINTDTFTRSHRKQTSSTTTKLADRQRKNVPAATTSAYLIEKMLNPAQSQEEEEENTEEVEEFADVEPSPEHELYREARTYDKIVKKSHIIGSGVGLRPKVSSEEPVRTSRGANLAPPVDDNLADNVSESGTYTIEVHQKDISEARESIDKVFGVEDADEDVVDFDVVVGPQEGLRHLEATRGGKRRVMPDSRDTEAGISTYTQELDGHQLLGQGPPKWVSQWAGQKVPGSAAPVTSKPGSSSLHDNSDTSDTKPLLTPPAQKPPYIPSRRSRVGSGRKLPSPPEACSPVVTNQPCASSPQTTPRSSEDPDRDTDSPGRQRATITYDTDGGGFFEVSFDAPVRQSSVPRDEDVLSSGRSPAGSPAIMRKDRCSSASSNEQSRSTEHSHSPGISSRTGVAMDTQALLDNTEAVIEAIKKRTSHKRTVVLSNGRTSIKDNELFLPVVDNHDSDSEGSSTCAVVDGRWSSGKDRDTSLPASPQRRISETKTTPKSRKPNFNKSISVDPRHLTSPQQAGPTTPKERKKSAREEYFSQLATKTRRSTSTTTTTKRNIKDRDRNSMEYSESESVVSTSTDYSETTTSPRLARRAGSGGKGNIAVTRPNRAFALRRAKADGSEGTSDASTVTSKSSRPNSASKVPDAETSSVYSRSSASRSRSTSRTRPSSAHEGRSQKLDVSVGLKKVQKSRDNQRQPANPTTPTGLARSDGGRHSFKSGKVSNVSSMVSNKQSKDSRSKQQVKPPTTARSSSSSTSGMSVSSTSTKPPSQPESPRSQEYSAWQRRKKYDPRKAAEDAKTPKSSPKKAVRSKSAAEADQMKKRSLGGTVEVNRSMSSSEDCSEPVRDPPTRGHLPTRGHVADIVGMSAAVTSNINALTRATETDDDEEDPKGLQSFRSSLSSDLNRSAFSVPKSKMSPSPPQLAGGTRRAFSVRHLLQEEANPLPRHESYDTLIVSSIQHLSQKIKGHTSNIAAKLREKKELEGSPSPVSDLLNHDLMNSSSDITGWKSANQELASILRNLRSTEHQLSAIGRALHCPEEKYTSPKTRTAVKSDYLYGKARTTGFQPIEKPVGGRPTSGGRKSLPKQNSRDSDNSDQLTGSDYY